MVLRIFVSQSLHPLVMSSEVLEVPGFESDHRVLSHSFDVSVDRQISARNCFADFKRERFNQSMATALRAEFGEASSLPPLPNTDSVDDALDRFLNLATSCVARETRLVQKQRNRLGDRIKRAVQQRYDEEVERSVADAGSDPAKTRSLSQMHPAQIAARLSVGLHRRGGLRYGATFLGRRFTIFRASKAAAKAAQPRSLAHMPELQTTAPLAAQTTAWGVQIVSD